MINENIKVEKKEKEDLPLLAEDVYQVELADLTSKEVQTYNSKMDKEAPVEYENVLKALFVIVEEENRGRFLFKDFIPTYLYVGKNGKNMLYQITEALLGHELTPEEEASMDTSFLNSLVGKQCRVTVKHFVKGDNTYANIDTYLKAKEQMSPLTSEEKEKAVLMDTKDEPTKSTPADEVVTPEDIPF